MNPGRALVELLEVRGIAAYFNEPVSQCEHAVQAAVLAQRERAAATLIVAALLHDVGHLLHSAPESVADLGIDVRHEEIGARWLSRFFTAEVTEPIRLHVAAKRYLCAREPGYLGSLSTASQQSLALQGGAFDDAAAHAFLGSPHAQAAIRLRRWDDAAKVRGLHLPPPNAFRELIERV